MARRFALQEANETVFFDVGRGGAPPSFCLVSCYGQALLVTVQMRTVRPFGRVTEVVAA
jgi:hypothetical protein